MAADVHLNGAPRSLEERLAEAQAEGLAANLRRTLGFVGATGVVELQALGVRRGPEDSYERVNAAHATSSASAVKLATEAEQWITQGLYTISAKLKPGVETRRGPDRWHELGKRGGTSDDDIAARRILPLDFDVERVALISATAAEMRLSAGVALRAWGYLVPIVGERALAFVHSGNGRQVWIALDDIAEKPDVKQLVCSILAGVDALFSTGDVKVDLKMGDAKRLVPACGTTKKKGAPGIAERPHRRTAIVTAPDPKKIDLDGLRELHARIRQDCDEVGRVKMDAANGVKAKPGPAKVRLTSSYSSSDSPFDRANAIDPVQVAEWLDLYESGSLRCPGCGESAGVDVIDFGLKCLHNRCDGKGKKGFRTNVDLTMEVRGVDAREAVNLLGERFGFAGLPRRTTTGADGADDAPFADDAPPNDVRSSSPGKRQPTTLADVAARWRSEGPLIHIPTGIARLDELTDGGPVLGSRWYELGAPDAGKTALIVQLGHVWASTRDMEIGYLAVDEEDGDLATRFAQRLKFSRRDCEDRSEDVMDDMEEAFARLPNVHFYDQTWTIEDAADDLAALAKARSNGTPVHAALFIDSIQQVSCAASLAEGARDWGERQMVTANVRAVRSVATAHRMFVMATSEMNRAAYRNIESAERSNDMAAGKESGAIEFSARVMLALRSVKDHGDLLQMRVVKNKHGPSGDDLHLTLDRRRMTLTQAEAPEEDDAEEDRQERGHAKHAADAALVALMLVEEPGISVNALHDAMRARHGSFAEGRVGVALRKLGKSVLRRPGERSSVHLYLAGGRVPSDVLAQVPLELRPAVANAMWPEEVEA